MYKRCTSIHLQPRTHFHSNVRHSRGATRQRGCGCNGVQKAVLGLEPTNHQNKGTARRKTKTRDIKLSMYNTMSVAHAVGFSPMHHIFNVPYKGAQSLVITISDIGLGLTRYQTDPFFIVRQSRANLYWFFTICANTKRIFGTCYAMFHVKHQYHI